MKMKQVGGGLLCIMAKAGKGFLERLPEGLFQRS